MNVMSYHLKKNSLWSPLFQVQWDRCDKSKSPNLFSERKIKDLACFFSFFLRSPCIKYVIKRTDEFFFKLFQFVHCELSLYM
jgi:hypothetical protein